MTQLRVRARAVDMLGRQQIAGIPTAIHELFKNAHDAYAERVEVDYFRRNGVLILRDDGYGMTRKDVEARWLTLGTESRFNANETQVQKNPEWRGPKNLPKRSIMGEKGIGRLAIAVIAPMTLLLTRASHTDGLKNLVVSLVHWGIFEQPGIDISEIDIPIKEFEGGSLPSREDVQYLADHIEKNLQNLKEQIEPLAFLNLIEDLQRVREIGPDMLDITLNKNREEPLSLAGNGYGTHFIMLPVAPELDDDIDGGSDKESSKLERNLLGFSNLMAMNIPVIKTEFRDHKLDGIFERIGSRSFFSNEDFEKSDQYFEGEFDDYGQFVGTVSIYGKPRKFVCNWINGKGRRTKCGAFSLRYGYVQGRMNESSLSSEDWLEITAKTDKVGGLYIYRDGIRILPYGNSDVDWLDIEKRRTLAAKDWYFSYRRGFGYVAIKHSENRNLTEKAGREGFRENQAYRDFRGILVNFFRQLAYEFFRVSSPQGEDFNEGKSSYAAQAEILKKQQEKADNRRKTFQSEIDKFFSLYNNGYFENESEKIISDLKNRIESLSSGVEIEEFSSEIRRIDIEYKKIIRDFNNNSDLSLPRGLALNNRLKKDWIAYEHIKKQLQEKILEPLRLEVESLIRQETKDRIDFYELRNIALQDVEKERDNVIREISELRKDTTKALEIMHSSVKQVLKEEYAQLRANVELLVDEFTKISAKHPDKLEEAQHQIENKISAVRTINAEFLDAFKRQLLELATDVKDRETLDERFSALETENEVLKEKIEFYADFAQMGMSVGILQHEFESAARGIRGSMAELKPWADRNPPLTPIYRELRDHIEHLDGYLKVLDPLGRRMHRATVELSGSEILSVIRNVFSEQLSSSSISLDISHSFRGFKANCKSSALMGAFINIIDNAIFWLNSRVQGCKKIFLDSDESGFLISNNGPGIEERISSRIFDFGETTKPGGRGMGLAITREVLAREGFDIILLKSGIETSPTFKISPKVENDE